MPLIGITHTKDLTPIVREPRVLKVGIGIPKGRAISVYIGPQREWTIRFGQWEEGGGKKKLVMKTVAKPKNRAEAEEYYRLNREKAVVSNRPQKLPFFTFTRRVLNEKGEETFEPDFAAIEAHGPIPREVDIVLMAEEPFASEYAWWSASELKCHGDGVNALRVVSMGNDSLSGWKTAKDAGERYFPFGPCWTERCPNAGVECKPNGTLNFQLANSMRLGATSYFTTTSIRSCWQIFSALESIKTAAQRVGSSVMGLPIKLVLAPFRSNHNGQPATQYGVSLELRAEDIETLKRRLIETSWRPAVQQPSKLIEAAEDDGVPLSAASMAAEFYPEYEDDEAPAEPLPAAAATERTTSALAGKMVGMRPAPAPAQPNGPVAAEGQRTQSPQPTQSATPQSATPQSATPQSATPQSATPQPATPQPATPQPATQETQDLF